MNLGGLVIDNETIPCYASAGNLLLSGCPPFPDGVSHGGSPATSDTVKRGRFVDRFEYRVCQAQQSLVTFVDGQWVGSVANTNPDPQKALNSCPAVWTYLNQAGAEGWKLVSVTSRVQDGGQLVDTFYLRRQS
jgi:hypothetical protein